jgi:hypothetical protein
VSEAAVITAWRAVLDHWGECPECRYRPGESLADVTQARRAACAANKRLGGAHVAAQSVVTDGLEAEAVERKLVAKEKAEAARVAREKKEVEA